MLDLMVEGDPNVLRRVQIYLPNIWLSSIAAEETLIGRMSSINRARSPRTSLSLPQAHENFVKAIEDIRLLPILVYSEAADTIFRTFPASVLRIGAQDCRIAAQAIAHNMTVITRNIRDFAAIGARCEDWSA